MHGAGGALEVALALLRTPGERHALRGRPLPEGIETLLAVASGARPTLLAQVAARSGERPDVLLEAARFYAREVLFHPGGDAYRTLGVPPDATQDAIKTHHRLLQHWLHPDRLESEDDAVFAARINGAWARLRGPSQRAAYDAERSAADAAAIDGRISPHAGVAAWPPGAGLVDPPASPGRPWGVAGLAALAILLLAVLVALDGEREPPGLAGAQQGASESGGNGDEALQLSVPWANSNERTAAARAPRPRAPAVVTPRAGPVPSQSPGSKVRDVGSPMVVASTRGTGGEAPASAVMATSTPAASQASTSRSPPQVAAPRGVALPPAHVVDASLPTEARVREARKTGEALLRYLAGSGRTAPPVWNSPASQASAEAVKGALGPACRAADATATSSWRIGELHATVSADYACGGGEGAKVGIEMVWREQRWLVSRVAIEEGA